MIARIFGKKPSAFEAAQEAIAQVTNVFAIADTSLVVEEGRDRLTQFCMAHRLQPTADLERLVAALAFTQQEKTAIAQALREGRAFSVLLTQPMAAADNRRYLFLVRPLAEGGWLLMIQDFELYATALAPFMKAAAPRPKPARMEIPETADPQPAGAGSDSGWSRYLAQSPVPTVAISTTGQVLKQNAAFAALIGEPRAGRVGWKFLECLAEFSRESVATLFSVLSTPGNDEPADSLVLEVQLQDENETAVSLFASRMEASGAEPAGFLLQMIDMTDQKNLEMRFVHSQKMQAVGQLAGGIAHDFNNLLTAMIGFCDLLLIRHPAGDQSFADIMQIKQNANRAANLVRQLLAFSRRQTLRPELISITDTLADLANLIRRLIGENIEFKLVHGRDIWPVKVDQGQLEQVIINLAVNARDAMKEGGTLQISTENVTLGVGHRLASEYFSPAEDDAIVDGEYVKIEVSDTGHGIPPEILRKIFEPFFSTKEVGAGTGLGLSTVYGIVKQTEGYIYVASKQGKGTRFAIFLKREHPVAGATDAASGSAASGSENEAETVMDLTGVGNILLVEDEAPVRIFSARALRNKGYKVLEADCAEAAFKVVEEQKGKLDIIVTDVVMPGVTGPAMVEQILKAYPNIEVIFISGYAEDAFLKTYGTERSFNFLPKPFSLKQLASKVKEVLEKK